MELGIAGKVALVLGASGGLGGGAARALAAEGVTVVATGRNTEALAELVAEIEAAGGTAVARRLDLSDIASIDSLVGEVEQAIGPIDILVNVSGGPKPSPVVGQSAETWRQNFEAMILSIITLTDRVLPGMRERGWGRIITNTSSGPVAPIENLGISNTLRASLHGWSKALSNEVAADGVTSNIVVPGRILTNRVRTVDSANAERSGRSIDEVTADAIATIPAGRYGTPEEYGAVIAFLASVPAGYLTGSIVRVDGGAIPSV